MSDRLKVFSSQQVPQPSTSEAAKSDSERSSLDEAVYGCACGTPDASVNWICCDNDDCPVRWYHWECAGVTEEPSGDWLCSMCGLRSTKGAGLGKQRRGVKTPMFPKLGKTAATAFNGTLDRENKSGRGVADKTHVGAKKGVAVKKAPPKKEKPKWIGWVEMTSEGEEEYRENVFAAQGAVSVANGRRTKARATQSMERPTRSRTLRGTSKQAAKGKRGARRESEEGNPDEEDRTQTAEPRNQPEYLEPVPRLPKRTPTNAVGASIPPPDVSAEATNPTTPALSAQATHSPANALPDPSEDRTFAITVRHPSEVPSAPPASGAAMVIDTEEQGWTPLITSVAPDGGSSVDYWSYRTNTWCTIPLSAIRSTLPRLL